jgi:hypothetical protein
MTAFSESGKLKVSIGKLSLLSEYYLRKPARGIA